MCKAGDWKREVVPDHKFDFVDTREFTDNSFGMRMKYLWLFVIVLKSFLVYVSDIFTAITMATTDNWSSQVASCPESEDNGCVYIPFSIGKWLFIGCIAFSFLLAAYESVKSKKIIASRDISYAFTNVMANHYYSLRSYDHFCFFSHISDSTKKKDDFAFFIFFTFKSWKRLLLADAPRQTINALTLYAFYLSKRDLGPWDDFGKYFKGNTVMTTALTFSMLFSGIICAGSVLMLIVAGIFYIPLLCYIQGNLKEYVCHKVDKRIAEIIRRRNKQRQQKAAELAKKEAMGDFSHLKNKKGELVHQPLPQPTLPNVALDDDEFDDGASFKTRGPAPSTYTQDTYYSNGYATDQKVGFNPSEYPPMPAYANQGYGHQYSQSQGTFTDEQTVYDHNYGSDAYLPKEGQDQYGQDAYGYPADQQAYVRDPQAYSHDLHQYTGPDHTGFTGQDAYAAYDQNAYDQNAYAAHPGYAQHGYVDGDDARQGTPAPDYLHGTPAPDYRYGTPTPAGAYAQAQDYPSPTSGGPPQHSFAGQMEGMGHSDGHAPRAL